jgi:hypothetical protein
VSRKGIILEGGKFGQRYGRSDGKVRKTLFLELGYLKRRFTGYRHQ